MIDVIIQGLATYRISYMLVNEMGPFNVFHYLRKWTGIEYDEAGSKSVWNPLNPLICLYCTSVWVAPILYILPKAISRIFAASAIAVLIDKKSG